MKLSNSLNVIFFLLFTISHLNNPISAQNSHLSLGAGITFNFVPEQHKVITYRSSDQYVTGWKTALSPAMILKYGNKLEGTLKASYIRYEYNFFYAFGYTSFGSYTLKLESQVHHLAIDFLIQYSLFERAGIYFLAGPSMCIPFRIKETTTETIDHTYYAHREEYVNVPYFSDLQAVAGIGGYVRINERNVLSLEGSFRVGIIPLEQSRSYNLDFECRSYSIQLLISYIREMRK